MTGQNFKKNRLMYDGKSLESSSAGFMSKIKQGFSLQNLYPENNFSTFYQGPTFLFYHGSTGLLSLMQTSANFPPGCRKNLRFFKTLATYVC